MKNKLVDLNNHLFAQMERLTDEDVDSEKLDKEIFRTKAVASLAREMIAVGQLALSAERALGEGLIHEPVKLLGSGK